MDYDDNEFQNHLTGEASRSNSNKVPPVLQPFALPKFDFDSHLRFDTLTETEGFLNADTSWINDFSRGTSGIVFSSGAINESCGISRHNNVWSEATSSESVEMLLNSVGQDEVVVREDTVNKFETFDELMEQQMEPEKILSVEEMVNLQTNPSVDDTPGESSVLKTDAVEEPVLERDASSTVAEDSVAEMIADKDDGLPTVAEDSAMEEMNALQEQVLVKDDSSTVAEYSATEEMTAEQEHVLVKDDLPTVVEESSMEEMNAEQEHVLVNHDLPRVVEESSVDEKNEVLVTDTATVDAVDAGGHDKTGAEITDSLPDQSEDGDKAESKMDIDCSDETVQTVVTCSGELNNQETLLPETFDDEKDTSNHIKSSQNREDTTVDAPSVLVDAQSDSPIDPASEVENVEAVNVGETANPNLKEMELPDATVLERGDQALSTLEVGGQDVSGTEYQDLLVSSTQTSTAVEAPSELTGELTTLTSSVSVEKPESLSHQHMGVTASEHEFTFQTETHTQTHLVETSETVFVSQMDPMAESTEGDVSTFQTETHTQIHLVETSESIFVSQMDPMAESTKGDVSMACETNEGSLPMCNLKQSMELPVSAIDRDQDAKSSQIISESVVSESVAHVSADSVSKLLESKSQSDTLPTDKSETMIESKECDVFPLNPEELQHLSHDGAPSVSLTSSIDSHMVKISSDANEQSTFSEKEKVSSDEPEDSQTLPPVDASSSVSQMDQQVKQQTEDTQQNIKFVEGCPAYEESKDAVDADATGQVLLQQSEEKVLEENLVTEVANIPEPPSTLDKDVINEKRNNSSLADLDSDTKKDGQEEDNTTASGGVMTAGAPLSHPKGDVIEVGDSGASTSSEPSGKSHVTETEKAATNLETPLISLPTVKSSELQLGMTETNSDKKPEDQNISSFMSAGSPALNREQTFHSGLNLTSDPPKAEEISKAVNFPQATLVSPIVVGSPPTSGLEKTAAKSSKAKPERKPRRTSKSAVKETSKLGSSVKGATPFQHFQSGGKTIAVSPSSACSTENQQTLQTPALNAFGTLQAPATSLPDLNSSALASILRRPFTDVQQVQLRSQIFVYGALIQGTAPDETYMISAFGGPDGGNIGWEKAWRACVVRTRKIHVSTPETPLRSRAGKTNTPSASHTSRKESSAIKPMIPLSSPLWSLTTSLDTLQSSSSQRSSAAHQPLLSSSQAHQTPPVTNIVGHNNPWMSPLPYRNPWLASPQTSAFDVGSRLPVFPITEPLKLTPTKDSSLPYSGAKQVLSGSSSNVTKGTPTLEPASTVVAPAQHSTLTKSRKRKKMPVSVESGPSILNSLRQTELAVSPLISGSTSVPITTGPANMASNACALPNVASMTEVPMNLVSPTPVKKIKSSLPSPIFGGNLVPEAKQRSVLSEDTIDKLNEAKMHAEDASALATAAVSHSEYVWKQIEQQTHGGLQPETQGRIASAAVAIAAAAAVAKAAAAAANVAANAALQAKLMAEEASYPSGPVQGTPASILKGESAVGSSNSVLFAAREASKKRVAAATAATKRAENMDSIVKAAELASEAVSQAGILVSMGQPPLLNKLVEAGPNNYWRQAQESQAVQPYKMGMLEKDSVATSDQTFASPRTVRAEFNGSVRMADGRFGPSGKKTKGQKGHQDADMANNNAVVLEPEVGSKSLIDTQTESEQIIKTTNDEGIKEGSSVEVFKEGPGLRTAWYSANVSSIEDDKAYVLFNDLSVEQGSDKLKEWIALKGEGGEAPKIRIARSVTALPYEGTRKRRRAAIGDPIWKIGDRVDSWVHDSWLEGVITEKNKNDETTVTVHFPAQGDTLTIKAWNLRPSLVWKDGRWIECPSSGENISSSHAGDTPKEKRPRLEPPAIVAEVKDTSMRTVGDQDLGKLPQTGVLNLGVSVNTFNIGRSSREEDKPDPLRVKRTGLQKTGSKVIFGVPKPGKKKKFMDVSKHYVSEASNRTREPVKPVKPIVPQGAGSWRMPSKTISREKQTAVSRPKTLKPPVPKTRERTVTAATRVMPRKDSRNTTGSNMETDDAADQSGENRDPASGTSIPSKGAGEEQTTSSSQDTRTKNIPSSSTNKGRVGPSTGRLTKIEESKPLAESSSVASDGMEPRRSVRRIQPTSRLLEGLQTSMMTSKIPSTSHSRSQAKK